MMKKITLLFMLLTVSFGYAQLLEDFETTLPVGIGGLIYSSENGPPPNETFDGVMEQKANPVPAGNPSATAVEIVTDAAGQPWQNGQLYMQTGKAIDLSGTNKAISVLIYSTVPIDILAKVVDGPGGLGSEVATDASHSGGGWETLTFDFAIPKDCGGNCFEAFEVHTRILFFLKWNSTIPGWDCPFGGPCSVESVWIDDITKLNTAGTKDYKIAGLSTYPNPTGDSWTVKTQNINMSSIEVFDILGKNVLSLKPNASETTINGSSLKSGLYFARINTLNGSSSLKLIKN
jgi:hypothetical protein